MTQNSVSDSRLQGVVRMTRDIVVMTAVIELCVFLAYAARFEMCIRDSHMAGRFF